MEFFKLDPRHSIGSKFLVVSFTSSVLCSRYEISVEKWNFITSNIYTYMYHSSIFLENKTRYVERNILLNFCTSISDLKMFRFPPIIFVSIDQFGPGFNSVFFNVKLPATFGSARSRSMQMSNEYRARRSIVTVLSLYLIFKSIEKSGNLKFKPLCSLPLREI